jgi:hypothetical protein
MTTEKKLSLPTLKKMLRYAKTVCTRDWKLKNSIITSLKEKKSKIISIDDRRDSFYKQYYPLDLTENEAWTTFEKCYSLEFSIEKNKLLVEVTIYNGDNFSGDITSLRFSAIISVPFTFLTQIEESIKYQFECVVKQEYEEYLEKKKSLWVNKRMKTLLK